MEKLLSIGEVAGRLRVSVDVVRSLTENGQLKAVRTGGRHRRYKPEEIQRYQAKGRATAHDRRVDPATKKPRAVDHDLGEPELEEDHPTLEELEADEARQAARQRSQAEEERLEGWKKRGRELATYTGLPAEWRVKVIENLEDFVMTKRIPPTLSKSEAELIVQTQVNSFVKQYWEDVRQGQQKERDAAAERRKVDEDRQRIAEERRQKEREAEEERCKQRDDAQRVQSLTRHGNSRAWSKTITGWDWSEAQRARRDVERALKDEVKADWTEEEVDDLVDDVLDEKDDDENEDEDEEEEEEEEEGDESW
jgi:excisionase family DNA binding protein